tara:strand:+ start:5053 stop:5742 length:690 start_codon:yes stop_codon:yes gene_type:complete
MSLQSKHFNKLLHDARERMTCDTACQRGKKIEELKIKYEYAKDNMNTTRINEAERDYIVFSDGQDVYNDVVDDKLRKEAQQIGNEVIGNFNKAGQQITTDIESNALLLLNYHNILDLLKTYTAENLKLNKQIKLDGNDVLTNDRKTVYEEQGQTTLNTLHYALTVIYICFFIASLVYMFWVPSDKTAVVKVALSTGLVILFFLSTYILSTVISLSYYIYNMLPKNVNLS